MRSHGANTLLRADRFRLSAQHERICYQIRQVFNGSLAKGLSSLQGFSMILSLSCSVPLLSISLAEMSHKEKQVILIVC